MAMKPVLFNIASQPISSFGIFLFLAFASSLFIIWRLARTYDFNLEKTIDLVLITFLGGMLGARLYFVFFHQDQFDSLFEVLLINRFPGLSFWGGLFGGLLTLRILSSKLKISFWQAADFAIVGLFLGLAIASFGCLLGGCQYGLISDSSWAVKQAGLVGKRFPLQIVEAGLFLSSFFYLWYLGLRFHFTGKIAALGLIILGTIKFILEFFRGDRQKLVLDITAGELFSLLVLVVGVFSFYYLAKRSPWSTLKFLIKLVVNQGTRRLTLSRLAKSWYNLKISWRIKLQSMHRNLSRRFNVKSNPTKF